MNNQPIDPPCPRVNTYAEYLQSRHWRNLKDDFFATHGNHCLICDTTIAVQAHHWRYRRSWYDSTIEDLICLCERHHKKVHADGNHQLNKDQLLEKYFRHSLPSSCLHDLDWYRKDFERRGMIDDKPKRKSPRKKKFWGYRK